MSSPPLYKTSFASLKDTDTVAVAMQRMLDDRVSDLPVIDVAGTFLGMFRLERLYAELLPRAVLLDDGMTGLSFVSDTLGQLREKMREVEGRAVLEFAVKPDHVVHPETPPLEVVLLLHRGANNIPVVAPDSDQLVGMVSARDLLFALMPEGSR